MTFIILALIVLAFFSLLKSYNTIIKKRNQVENAMSSTDVILKKRYDLIPNLVESVKRYMQYEEKTLSKITELRSSLIDNKNTVADKLQKENELSSLLGRVIVSIENYPDLKSNTNMLHLQQSLMEIEEQVSAARRSYNTSVMQYNNTIETIPSNIMAGIIGAGRKSYFEIIEAEKENISVKNIFDGK